MTLDLETFLTALYVIVDDLYQSQIKPCMPVFGGPPAQMSDSEVLCLGLAAQWRSGVPWKSERGIIRYVRKHLGHLFPTVLTQSAFNRRLRHLWGAFILIQNAVADQLVEAGAYDVMDGCPIPVAHGARSFVPGFLADIARIGVVDHLDGVLRGERGRRLLGRRGLHERGACAADERPGDVRTHVVIEVAALADDLIDGVGDRRHR